MILVKGFEYKYLKGVDQLRVRYSGERKSKFLFMVISGGFPPIELTKRQVDNRIHEL